MAVSCVCGKFHYSLDGYFKVHGDYLGNIPEHRCQVKFLSNGRVFDPSQLKDNEPYPLLTNKWVCRYCGNFNTSDEPKSHKNKCEFVAYLRFRQTEPFKKGVFYTKPSESEKPSEKDTKIPTPDKKLSDSDLRKINNIRNELINIIVNASAKVAKWSEEEARQFRQENKDKKLGWFENNFNTNVKHDDKLKDDNSFLKKYIWYLNNWSDIEAKITKETFKPEKKRKIVDWYLLGKLSYNYVIKLEGLTRPDGTLRLDPEKRYLLSDLLLLIPSKKKKAKPSPENAPLADQINRFIKEYSERITKYIDLSVPPFFPEPEIDKLGKVGKHWPTEDNWKEFIENSKDTQDATGTYTDLQLRIGSLKYIFTEIVIKRLIEVRDRHGLEGFIANYTDDNEKAFYDQEPYKTQIYDILTNPATRPPVLGGDEEKKNYYDELFTKTERENMTELDFKPLTIDQWNKIGDESSLRKGVFELRKFPNLTKLTFKEHRPFTGADIIKKVDISGTADKLEDLDLSQSNIDNLILGKKTELKKVDVRWTSLKKLNLSRTKLTPNDYDTLNFPIRKPTAISTTYKDGEIVNPFDNFNGDSTLITLHRRDITFNMPWVRYGKDWSNIANEFIKQPELIQEWYDCKFDYETAKSWMDIFGTDKERIKRAKFCKWLRDVKKKNAEWVLNYGNLPELEEEFKNYKPPKN